MKSAPRPEQLFSSIAMLWIAAGCSKDPTAAEPAAAEPAAAAPSGIPLVERRAADPAPASDEYRDSFAPGGVAATYRATFSDGKIQSLEETRTATSQTGTYEFLGARLIKYRGTALDSNAIIELEFDEQGTVLVARAGDKDVSAAEIAAIRNRARALRSHAVARRGVQGHESR